MDILEQARQSRGVYSYAEVSKRPKLKAIKLAQCPWCLCNDDRNILLEGMVTCEPCGHLKYHCQCRTEWWRNGRPKKSKEKKLKLTAPKPSKRKKKGTLVIADDQQARDWAQEDKLKAGHVHMFMGQEELKRLQATEWDPNGYHGEW